MALDDLPVRVESWTGDVPDRQAQVKKGAQILAGFNWHLTTHSSAGQPGTLFSSPVSVTGYTAMGSSLVSVDWTRIYLCR